MKEHFAFGGGYDLCINNQCSQNNNSYIYPHSYNTTETNELNGGERNFTVLDYKVYSVEY